MGKGVGVLWTGKKKRAPGVAGPSGTGDDLNRAVLYMVFAAVLIPFLNASAKYLSSTYPVLEITWARYAGHFAHMLIAFAPQRGLSLLASSRPMLQLVRSSLLCVSTLIFVMALRYVPLPTATAISFTSPFIVTAPLHRNRACPTVARRGRGAVSLVHRGGRVLGRADRGAAGHHGHE